jgi:hypothetical protein
MLALCTHKQVREALTAQEASAIAKQEAAVRATAAVDAQRRSVDQARTEQTAQQAQVSDNQHIHVKQCKIALFMLIESIGLG